MEGAFVPHLTPGPVPPALSSTYHLHAAVQKFQMIELKSVYSESSTFSKKNV